MGTTEELAANVVGTRFDSIDAASIERAKWRIIDSLGCLMAGANAAGCREMADLVGTWGGAGESTVLVHGIKGPALNVAMANSLMTRSFDFEPVDAEGETKTCPAHISGTTVPSAITMAERQGASGRELLTALIVGDDLAARLGVASGFDFALGWDNTGTINAFGATAIAGKLMKLNEKQMVNAFGIVVNQLGGSMAHVWDKVMVFKLPIALAARNGIFSADLAARGFTGLKDAFLGRHGYFSLYCPNHDISGLTRNLGKRFYADRVIKPYSACRATHSAIDSALKIARENTIDTERIAGITVHLTPGALNGFTGQPFVRGETPQIDGAFSIRYTVACALLRKGVKPAYFTDECTGDPKIRGLIDKMELVAAIPAEKAPATEIRVRMDDGTVFSAGTDFPTGDIYKTPLTQDEIREKYRNNAAFSRTVAIEKSERVLEMVESLEEIDDVREITGLLVEAG